MAGRFLAPRARRMAMIALVGVPVGTLGLAAAYRQLKSPQLPPHTLPDLRGRTVLITGATSGIGEAAALQLAERGATMVIGSRDHTRGSATRDKLLAAGAPSVLHMDLDMSSPASVETFCARVLRAHPHLDVVVNAAAEILTSPQLTSDGVHTGFATNHLGLHALCMGLEPGLFRPDTNQPRPRVVIVGSRLERKGSETLSLPAIESTHGARIVNVFAGDEMAPMDHYAATKHANMLLSQSLGERWGAAGPAVLVVTPGMVNTNLWRHYSLAYRTATYPLRAVGLRSPQDAAAGVTFAAAAIEADARALYKTPTAVQKKAYIYLSDGLPVEPSDRARDSASAAVLFESCDRLLRHIRNTGAQGN